MLQAILQLAFKQLRYIQQSIYKPHSTRKQDRASVYIYVTYAKHSGAQNLNASWNFVQPKVRLGKIK